MMEGCQLLEDMLEMEMQVQWMAQLEHEEKGTR